MYYIHVHLHVTCGAFTPDTILTYIFYTAMCVCVMFVLFTVTFYKIVLLINLINFIFVCTSMLCCAMRCVNICSSDGICN